MILNPFESTVKSSYHAYLSIHRKVYQARLSRDGKGAGRQRSCYSRAVLTPGHTVSAGLPHIASLGVGGRPLVHFLTAQSGNNHTETVSFKSLLGLLALVSYCLTLTS